MFSVIVPLYNKESTIKDTIQSVLNQTWRAFELIVIDDGSTDNSAKIIEVIKDQRLRLLHQNNMGVSAARNRGIKEARYEWIAFLDSDDFWKENHLSEAAAMIQSFKGKKVFVTSFEYSDKRTIYRKENHDNVYKIENYFKEALDEYLIWTGVLVAHKQCIEKVGGFNENLSRGEDLDLWARLARNCDIIKSKKITAVYNVSVPGSLSKGRSVYRNSILSIIDLRGLESYERIYFKRKIYARIKSNIVNFKILELMRIIYKHNIQLFI